MTSARKAKRRVVGMLASTVVIDLRWLSGDAEGERVRAWLAANRGTAAHLLRRAMREYVREHTKGMRR
jgi:hypothetical protein